MSERIVNTPQVKANKAAVRETAAAKGDNTLADLAAGYLDKLRRLSLAQAFLFANRGSDPFIAESAFATLAPDKHTILLTMARRFLRPQYELENLDTAWMAADYYRATYEANGHRVNLIGEAQYRLPQYGMAGERAIERGEMALPGSPSDLKSGIMKTGLAEGEPDFAAAQLPSGVFIPVASNEIHPAMAISRAYARASAVAAVNERLAVVEPATVPDKQSRPVMQQGQPVKTYTPSSFSSIIPNSWDF